MTPTAGDAGQRLRGTAPWILWCSSLAALLTTIHHLHGARIYDTPARYHAVWIVLGGLALQGLLLLLTRVGRLAKVAETGFSVVTIGCFVLAFGVFEGGYTHVVAPILAGGYGDGEPFDALFEVTGALQPVLAVVIAALTVRAHRAR